MRLIKVLLFIILALAFGQSFPIWRISQDEKTTGSNLALLQSSPRRSESLIPWNGLPRRFYRKLTHIPQSVLMSKPGTVVTYYGIGYIWQKKGSPISCFKACTREKLLTCNYYYYEASSKKCRMIMMEYDFLLPTFTLTQMDVDTEELELHNKENIHASVNADFPNSKLKRILEELDSSPTKFPGNLSDIPKEVLESDYGSVVTIGNVKQLWRRRRSLKACSQACEHEPLIKCVSYYYDVTGRKCIMFAKPSQKSKTETKPSSEVQESKTSSEMQNEIFLSEVQKAKTSSKKQEGKTLSERRAKKITNAKVRCLKHVILKIEALVDSKMKLLNKDKNADDNLLRDLRNDQVAVQKSINHLTNNVKQLRKVNPYLIKKINGMNGAQRTVPGELKNFGILGKKEANVLTDKKVSELDGDMSSVKETKEKLQREMNGEEFSHTQFNKNIVQLRRAIMDLINPTTIKIRKNQQILARALASINREIIFNERRLGHIDLSNSDWASHLIAEEQHRKIIKDLIQSLIKSSKDLRNDVRRLENPESSENTERTKEIRQMSSDIEILRKLNAKLEQDLAFARTDMTPLVKDLVNVRVFSQDRKVNVLTLGEANKNLAFDAKQQKADQNQILMEIQTLATVYRNVLSTLHTFEMKQIQVMHKLRKHENDMQHMSSDFIEHSNGFGTSLKKKKMMSQSLQYMFSMKNFQTKLVKQVNQLRRELFKIKQRYNKIMFGVEPRKEESLSQKTNRDPKKFDTQLESDSVRRKKLILKWMESTYPGYIEEMTKSAEYETFEHATDDKKNI